MMEEEFSQSDFKLLYFLYTHGGQYIGSKKISKNPDAWIIKSGCSVCGRSQEEVEKELKRKEII